MQDSKEFTYIYGLRDPRNGSIRYIGKTNYIRKRFTTHLWDKIKSKKTSWIKSLSKKGLVPTMIILEKVTKDKWMSLERRWIKRLRKRKIKLVNMTDGGEGGIERIIVNNNKRLSTLRKVLSSPEHRKIQSLAQQKRYSNPNERELQSKRLKGKKKSLKTRKKMSEWQKGKTLTLEHRKALSLAAKKRRSPKQIEHLERLNRKRQTKQTLEDYTKATHA